MKGLIGQLNEALNINESSNIKVSDVDKVHKMWSKLWLSNKLSSFITKYEAEVVGHALTTKDKKDIGSMMEMIHSYVISSKENDLLDYLPDFFTGEGVRVWVKETATTENTGLLDIAIQMYFKLYKEVTNKDLM